MKDGDEKKRDEVLKRMLNTPPESNKDMAKRKSDKRDETPKPLQDEKPRG